MNMAKWIALKCAESLDLFLVLPCSLLPLRVGEKGIGSRVARVSPGIVFHDRETVIEIERNARKAA